MGFSLWIRDQSLDGGILVYARSLIKRRERLDRSSDKGVYPMASTSSATGASVCLGFKVTSTGSATSLARFTGPVSPELVEGGP